ncbi:hypothetical protein QF038_003163 [Pseudarthrobacter sp. W1I19]|nr:hypothetical protein [Pseudarthrobacter sp. W1I19]
MADGSVAVVNRGDKSLTVIDGGLQGPSPEAPTADENTGSTGTGGPFDADAVPSGGAFSAAPPAIAAGAATLLLMGAAVLVVVLRRRRAEPAADPATDWTWD